MRQFCCRIAELVVGQIELVSLRINGDVDAALQPLRLRLSCEAVNAADTKELYTSAQLPTLGDRNGHANSGVAARTKPDAETFDRFA